MSHWFFIDDSLLFSNEDCMANRGVLDDYVLASEQVINFNKYAICVSNSISSVEGNKLAGIIGVSLVAYHERYLGLSSFASMNKKKLFADVMDKENAETIINFPTGLIGAADSLIWHFEKSWVYSVSSSGCEVGMSLVSKVDSSGLSGLESW
ncbi:hypothetical protein Dsin_005037 [Dipteronia sinensis]|uniref:Uncharacterized protein n=1 Tax=Dipteronia sinensis TaxID=43782 RepID=A0AAE0EG45_9ROSI|nr:hypothetical protein Dsin_005037 [Dipteronia sinensis]